ncbi:hypothetical protein CL653_03210 [bacterium]|nr:hypothetical protein [bacterium]|tara:strand:- start:1161 stop:2264 length:1104 start_codon:yes stop_codon:yes gene_type:complete
MRINEVVSGIRADPEKGENFKRWFGDSKVVQHGMPLVVYHGTPDVRELEKSGVFSSLSRKAFFFTDDYKVAKTYADDTRAWDYQGAVPKVISVFLSIQNPKIIDANDTRWDQTAEAIDAAHLEGHDGVIIKNSYDEYNAGMDGVNGRKSTVFVVFDPKQIKAVSNNGKFDPDNPNIYETHINAFQKDEELRHRYKDQVWEMLNNAYASIGGVKGNGFNSPDDMVKNIGMWKMVRKNDKIVAVTLYKDKKGRKSVASATDGTPLGKASLAKMIRDEFNHSRSYAEISDKLYYFARKAVSDDVFDAARIPAKQAKSVDNRIRLIPGEDFWYYRKIGDDLIKKMMLGSLGVRLTKSPDGKTVNAKHVGAS